MSSKHTSQELALANVHKRPQRKKAKPKAVSAPLPPASKTQHQRSFHETEKEKSEILEPTSSDSKLPIFVFPLGIAPEPNGDILVVDSMQHLIKRIDTRGNVTLVAGKVVVGVVTEKVGICWKSTNHWTVL